MTEKLHPDLEGSIEETPVGPWIKHPLVHTSALSPAEYINRLYEQKRAQLAKALEKKDYRQALWLHERPWRLWILNWWWQNKSFDASVLRDLLISAWVDAELPSSIRKTALIRLFLDASQAGFVSDIDTGDYGPCITALGGATIYRGVGGQKGGSGSQLDKGRITSLLVRQTIRDAGRICLCLRGHRSQHPRPIRGAGRK